MESVRSCVYLPLGGLAASGGGVISTREKSLMKSDERTSGPGIGALAYERSKLDIATKMWMLLAHER
jgi:hypothetical protein